MQATKPCYICNCNRPLLKDVAKMPNGNELIYRYRCPNCGAHTMWCNNELAAISLWNHDDVEK